LEGNPAPGYEVAAVNTNPPTLDLTAPAAILEKVVFLPTKPIDISGQKQDLTTQTSLDIGEEITEMIGEPAITVRIQIKEEQVSRRFQNVPVEFNHKAERTTYRLDHNSVDIVTEMPYNLAAKDTKDFHFEAIIDADALPPGNHELPVRIIPTPPGIKIKEVMPPKVKIDISPPQPLMKKQIASSPSTDGPNRQ
jgi:YbbR domain-containing protein